MTNQLLVPQINRDIAKTMGDPETKMALIQTVFKGLGEPAMRQAMLEAYLRGFELKDFLNKDVYAIPFKSGYSLITSIDYMRKIAAQNGSAGINEPVYEDDQNGRPKTCSVTVKRIVKGEVFEYTAKVYLGEYDTGSNPLWKTKPRTMLAKVAEMHAMRKAFPEELSKAYIEEETQQTIHVDATVREVIDYVAIQSTFDSCETEESLKSAFLSLSKAAKADASVISMAKERKQTILAGIIPTETIPAENVTIEAETVC